MKRWAFITVALYLLLLLCLTLPVGLAAFGWGPVDRRASVLDILQAFTHAWYWICIGVAMAGQVLLLAVPVALSEGRPRARRHLLVPVITAAFLLALVCLSALATLSAGIWGDYCDKPFRLFGNTDSRLVMGLAFYFCVAWLAWALVFRGFLADTAKEALTGRLTRWLLRGSILELLVAVPSHVIARERKDCCAPAITLWGIVTGLTVMLLSFGPGVFYLFAERRRRLKPPTGVQPLRQPQAPNSKAGI